MGKFGRKFVIHWGVEPLIHRVNNVQLPHCISQLYPGKIVNHIIFKKFTSLTTKFNLMIKEIIERYNMNFVKFMLYLSYRIRLE